MPLLIVAMFCKGTNCPSLPKLMGICLILARVSNSPATSIKRLLSLLRNCPAASLASLWAICCDNSLAVRL